MPTASSTEGRPPELVRLLNLLISVSIAIMLAFLLQLILIGLWWHVVNRKFYEAQQRVAPSGWKRTAEQDATPTTTKTPTSKFLPFPKSLVWPVPLFFTCSLFVTGLTRASVLLLASAPEGCGVGCPFAAI